MGRIAPPGPLRGARLAITAVALASGTFMQVLDSTIANVSLPTIAGNLGVSTDDSTWVVTAFAAANGITVPLTGWLMARFGVVRTFSVSVVLFAIASFLCGVAWSLPTLVVFRLLQGAVSGPMIPGSQALLIMIFPPEKRGTALGVWSITTLVGPVLGPILGGYICDNYHWGLIFLINVPVGIACAFVSWTALNSRETLTRKLPIDIVGLLLLAGWVGVLDLGKNDDWFNSPTIVVLSLLAAITFAGWIIWELTEERPIVDLGLFRSRSFTIGVVGISLGYALFFANNLLLPLWLQQQLSYTATWAGLVAAPSGAVAVLLTPFVTPLISRYDARIFASLSFVAFAISYFMRSAYTPDADFLHFMAPLLMQGAALSVFFVSLLSVTLDGVPPEQTPAATGLSNFVRITAGSFSASLITTFWDRRENLHQTQLASASSPLSQTYQQALGVLKLAGLSDRQAAGAVGRQLVGQSYLLSSIELFWICGWISLAVIGLIWLTRRPSGGAGPAAAV
jgi:DHA2 family multidrug resistance protein